MIFYEVEKAGGHYLVATQADAKREAREQKCTWAQVDVPTDKAGLMAYINSERSVDRLAAEEARDMSDEEVRQSNTPEAQREAAIRMTPVEPRMPSMSTDTGRFKLRVGNEADQIAEYILDEKTPAFAVSTILGAAMERVERLTRLLD